MSNIGRKLFGGNTTTSSTSLPDANSQEQSLNEFIMQMFPEVIKQSGYSVEKKPFELNAGQQAKVRQLSEQMTDAQRNVEEFRNRGDNKGATKMADLMASNQRQIEDIYKNAEQDAGYSVRETYSEEAEQARQKYGDTSQQYNDAVSKVKGQRVYDEQMRNDLNTTFLQQALKFANGDFTLNEQQKQFVKDEFAPQRAALEHMYGQVKSPQELQQTLDNLANQSKQTGMDSASLLGSIGVEIERGNQDINNAIDKVSQVRRDMMKMGIEDFTGERTQQVMSQAAQLGRDPLDPAFQRQIQQDISREVQRGELQIGSEEQQARLGLAQQTAEQRTGLARESGMQRLGLEQQAQAFRNQIGAGMAPQQIGTAMNVEQFNQARQAQGMANLQAGLSMPQQMLAQQQQLRMAQATTKQTAPSKGILGTALGLGAAAAGIYSGVATAGASGAMADYYRGMTPSSVGNISSAIGPLPALPSGQMYG